MKLLDLTQHWYWFRLVTETQRTSNVFVLDLIVSNEYQWHMLWIINQSWWKPNTIVQGLRNKLYEHESPNLRCLILLHHLPQHSGWMIGTKTWTSLHRESRTRANSPNPRPYRPHERVQAWLQVEALGVEAHKSKWLPINIVYNVWSMMVEKWRYIPFTLPIQRKLPKKKFSKVGTWCLFHAKDTE